VRIVIVLKPFVTRFILTPVGITPLSDARSSRMRLLYFIPRREALSSPQEVLICSLFYFIIKYIFGFEQCKVPKAHCLEIISQCENVFFRNQFRR